MMNVLQVRTPLTKSDIAAWRSGDVLEISGEILTARDAAHKRMQAAFDAGLPQVMDFSNQLVFYTGPSPAKPGRVIGSIAPTTSMRMDSFVEMTFALGFLGMIGKGDRGAAVAEACRKHGGVYLLSVGGASAMIANQITSCDVVAYDDLGTESIKRLGVDKLRVIVGIDTQGRVFQDSQVAKYRRVSTR